MTAFSTSHPRAASRGEADAPHAAGGGAPSHGAEPGDHDGSLRDQLAAQVDLLRRLVSLGEQQRGHIEAGDVDSLLGVLGRRQELIDQLLVSDRAIAPRVKQRSTSQASGLIAGADNDDVDRLLDEARALRQKLLEQDERDREALASMCRQLGADLRHLSHSGQAAAAYQQRSAGAYAPGGAARQISRFTDQKG